MKEYKWIILLLISGTCMNCSMQDFSEELELNNVEIKINNKIEYDFVPDIYIKKSDKTLGVRFQKYFDQNNYEKIGFSLVNFLEEQYIFSDIYEDRHGDFSNTYPYYIITWDLDQSDADYEPMNMEKGYLKISEIDTMNTTVRGSFRSDFIRIRKGEVFEEPRGKKVKFEGQFYAEYEIR